MRTTIILSALIIAESINPAINYSEKTMGILGFIFTIYIVMDIVDFFKK